MAAQLSKEEKERLDFELKCRLINLMRDYPLIYDKANAKHYNRDARVNVFTDIGLELDLPGKQILFA